MLACHTPLLRDGFGRLELVQERVALQVLRRDGPAEAELLLEVGADRDPAHGFDPAGDDDVDQAALDQARGQRERLLGGATLSVDCGGGNLLREPRRQPGRAADVERLLSDLPDTPGDDLLDLATLNTAPRQELGQDPAQEPRGMGAGQTSIAPTEGC